MKRLLVRADDLGYSRGVNYGIYDSVHNGIINNVGLMVNMDDTEHGLTLLEHEDVALGLHVVISAGKPIIKSDGLSSITTEDGFFKSSKIYRSSKQDFVDLDEVVAEIEAQYQKFLSLVGKKPDYFEGHAVMSPNFIKGLEIVAKKYNLPLLHFSFDSSGKMIFKNVVFSGLMDSMKLEYNPYNTLERAIALSDEQEIPMMICHPGYLDKYIMDASSLTIPRIKEVAMACDLNVRKMIIENKVNLLKYSDI